MRNTVEAEFDGVDNLVDHDIAEFKLLVLLSFVNVDRAAILFEMSSDADRRWPAPDFFMFSP